MNVTNLDLCKELYELRDVPGLEDRFMVSSEGEIISKPSRTGKGVTRKLTTDGWGYKYASYKVDGKVVKLYAHRAVALAFLGPVAGKNHVNHKDSNPAHNHPHNLEWCTPGENVEHSRTHGRANRYQNRGEAHGMSKLTEEQVREIKAIHFSYSLDYMAKRFGVSEQTIRDIRNGRRWKHVN